MSFESMADEEPVVFPFKVLSRGDLDQVPPVEPLIDGVLDRRGVAVLAGPWACGKSFVALSWALSVSCGVPWLGRNTHNPGPVLVVIGEGLHGLLSRVEAWESAWNEKADQLHILHESLSLVERGAAARLVETVRQLRPTLVVVDTLSRAMVGAEENSAKDMSVAVRTLGECAETCDGLVVVVHHTGKDGTTVRGSSALEGGADRVWKAEGDPGLLTLTAAKVKDGPKSPPLALRCRPVLGSLVVEDVGTRAKTDANDHEVVALVSQLCSAVPQTKSVIAEAIAVGLGKHRSTGYRNLNALVEAGSLRNVGTDGRPLYLWVGAP